MTSEDEAHETHSALCPSFHAGVWRCFDSFEARAGARHLFGAGEVRAGEAVVRLHLWAG